MFRIFEFVSHCLVWRFKFKKETGVKIKNVVTIVVRNDKTDKHIPIPDRMGAGSTESREICTPNSFHLKDFYFLRHILQAHKYSKMNPPPQHMF